MERKRETTHAIPCRVLYVQHVEIEQCDTSINQQRTAAAAVRGIWKSYSVFCFCFCFCFSKVRLVGMVVHLLGVAVTLKIDAAERARSDQFGIDSRDTTPAPFFFSTVLLQTGESWCAHFTSNICDRRMECWHVKIDSRNLKNKKITKIKRFYFFFKKTKLCWCHHLVFGVETVSLPRGRIAWQRSFYTTHTQVNQFNQTWSCVMCVVECNKRRAPCFFIWKGKRDSAHATPNFRGTHHFFFVGWLLIIQLVLTPFTVQQCMSLFFLFFLTDRSSGFDALKTNGWRRHGALATVNVARVLGTWRKEKIK